MTASAELRKKFLNYFEGHGHSIVASSSLVPGNDPTLLFTNAGMVQFKDVFLGTDKRSYNKAATSQRCVRAGGKHNDLENVGYTARHHTFFEMLGNFSFGDYFKEKAIFYAWDFLTDVIGLPVNKLWVTVYSEDYEATDIWLNKIGVDPTKLTRISTSDNFWSMGDTGPCGPCSEIFYDHGPEIEGGPPGTAEEDGDRYIEIWNLVFMQYNRDEEGTLNPLPKPSVDTGMGLERITAVLQNAHNNYDIDLFQVLIKSAGELTGINDLENKSLRVIADHIRSCAFLVVDGVLPSNEGRGYVLRRIIRRAARHGHQLGCKTPFFHKLVYTLDHLMGEAYPELTQYRDHVIRVLQKEEERFSETLELGMDLLEQVISGISSNRISGPVIFKLYDTFGFPVDLTADVARERGLEIDLASFEAEMEAQKKRARASSKFSVVSKNFNLDGYIATEFFGYEHNSADANVIAIMQNDILINILDNGDKSIVILDQTPFYAESGGQVGDTGLLIIADSNFQVIDTYKQNNLYFHVGQLISGQLSVGDSIHAVIDAKHRQAVMLNHSSTHLMHEALKQILGEHVQQKGSLVDAEKLRFDFSHYQPVTKDEITQIETWVNDQIRLNVLTRSQLMNMDEAKEAGAMALFGEKYGDVVRVLSIGSDSVELCGGTHVQRTGDIGLFKMTLETGTASGVRRIEAVTGRNAFRRFTDSENEIDNAAHALKSNRNDLVDRIQQLQINLRVQEKELVALKLKAARQTGDDLLSKTLEVRGIKVLTAVLEGADVKTLRDTVDQLKNKLVAAVVVFASSQNGKVNIIAGVTKLETSQIRAGDIVKFVAEQCGGKGGGRPDMAQGGGTQPENLQKALTSVVPWIESQI